MQIHQRSIPFGAIPLFTAWIALAGGCSGEIGSLPDSGIGKTPDGASTGTDAAGVDSGTVPPDAGVLPDAGIPPDGGSSLDASSGIDAGTKPDAGSVAGDGGTTIFTIDVSKGPNRQFQPPAAAVPVSPYVYGINAFGIWENTTKWGLARQGGDAFTDWNWTNNYGNSAADYCYWEGQEGGGTVLAGAITNDAVSIPTEQSLGVAYLATVPIVDFVSSQFVNNTGINNLCPGTCNGGASYSANTGNLVFASTNPASPAFVANNASKTGAFCTCQPGGPCTTGCAPSTTGPVYQDEFINYLKVTYGAGGAPIFFSLDNEPNYWSSTHPEVWPYTGTVGCGTDGTTTYDDIVSRNITYAKAIKKVWPAAKVFGPIVAQDGILYAHSYTDSHLPTEFADYYLAQMAAASTTAGAPLIDAFDVHYYSVGRSGAECLQVPRMFWDSSFTAFAAATVDAIDFGWNGIGNHFDTAWYPRQVVPRLLNKIATAYAGNATAAPGLSFSEYNAGCELQIEGAVAQADLLGIFGREGVFAATAWPLKGITSGGSLTNYLVAAYDLYRNYDGTGAAVGDTTVWATTSDIDNTSVYAFTQSTNANTLDVVAINKSSSPTTVTIVIANAPAFGTFGAHHIVSGSTAVVAATGPSQVSCAAGSCTLTYTLPATSATTITLRP